jgi:hypothetical protein
MRVRINPRGSRTLWQLVVDVARFVIIRIPSEHPVINYPTEEDKMRSDIAEMRSVRTRERDMRVLRYYERQEDLTDICDTASG